MVNQKALKIFFEIVKKRSHDTRLLSTARGILLTSSHETAEDLFLISTSYILEEKIDEGLDYLNAILRLPESQLHNIDDIDYHKIIRLLKRYLKKTDYLSFERSSKILMQTVRSIFWDNDLII